MIHLIFTPCFIHFILVRDILVNDILAHDIEVPLGILELLVSLCILDILVPDILSTPWYPRASSFSLYPGYSSS